MRGIRDTCWGIFQGRRHKKGQGQLLRSEGPGRDTREVETEFRARRYFQEQRGVDRGCFDGNRRTIGQKSMIFQTCPPPNGMQGMGRIRLLGRNIAGACK